MIKFIKSLLRATAVLEGEEKLENAIAFFASEYERLTQKPLPLRSLHRYLTLIDHASSEKVGHPVLGLFHRTRARLLTDPYEGREARKDDPFVVIRKQGEYLVKAAREPDLSRFTAFELKEMRRLVQLNADRLGKVLYDRFSAFERDEEVKRDRADGLVGVHKRDDTREGAWAEIKAAVMDVPERNFFAKHKEVDEMTGLRLLIEKYETRVSELETQLAEVKHKLEIATEAMRLLKEEGLSEDDPKPRWP